MPGVCCVQWHLIYVFIFKSYESTYDVRIELTV